MGDCILKVLKTRVHVTLISSYQQVHNIDVYCTGMGILNGLVAGCLLLNISYSQGCCTALLLSL